MALGPPSIPTPPGPLPPLPPPSGPAPPGPIPPSTPPSRHIPNVADSATIAEHTDTTGLGPYRLNGALAGCFRFRDDHADGEEVTYIVSDGPNTEVVKGILTFGSPDTLSRDMILASSNGNAAINWSGGTRPLIHEAAGALIDDDTCDMQDIYTGTSV